MPTINNIESRRAGILADLKETWRQSMPKWEQQTNLLVRKLSVTNLREASYVWKESLPFPSYWPYGKGREYKTFRDRRITVNLWNYELSIPWAGFDADDDQLGDVKTHVQSAVDRYGQLPIVLLSEYFNGTAVEQPALSYTYDGASLYSATDGDGSNRLGVSGGNIITGTGATTSGVLHDFASAQQRFMSFVDPTASKPIFDESMVGYDKMTAIIPKELNEIFQKATQAEFIKVDPGNITSETNYLKGTFKYVINPFLTDTSDWYIVLDHSFYKPFVYRAPGDVSSIIADASNSDHAREYNEFVLYTHVRLGLAPFFPGSTIKVNN